MKSSELFTLRRARAARSRPDPDGVIARDWASYRRGEQRLRERMNSRPVLNPNGPTPLGSNSGA